MMVVSHTALSVRQSLALKFFQNVRSSPFFRKFQSSSLGSGLYGIRDLQSPSSFKPLGVSAVKLTESLSKNIKSSKYQPCAQTVIDLDLISESLCLVLDSAELCRSTHADPKWREAADETYNTLANYITKLNMDSDIYQPLKQLTENRDIFEQLSLEEQRVSISLKEEFERDGIHLQGEKRSQVEDMQIKARELEDCFTRLGSNPRGQIELTYDDIESLDPDIRAIVQGRGRYTSANSLIVQVDNYVYSMLLGHAKDGRIRKKVYFSDNEKTLEQNLQVLDSLVNIRRELSELLGFKSYAHLITSYKMARKPETVVKFLEDLSNRVSEYAKREKGILEKKKIELEGPNSGGLHIWDVPFYMNLIEKEKFGNSLEDITSYFSVENCLNGMKLVSKSLFGISLNEVDFEPGEAWAPDLRKLELVEENGEIAGCLYLDLYPRPGKYGNAAHFQISSGRVKSSKWSNKKSVASAALVCSFNASRSFPLGLSSNYLLTHNEVQVLFHEFGHALHSLLSRTELQHLAGTRGELDFVETPAQLMEYFALDERVLSKFAKHYITGSPISGKMVKDLKASKSLFPAINIQQQILYAVFDQALFGPDFDHKAGVNSEKTNKLITQLEDAYRGFPNEKNNFWHARFTHFVSYGATYYSYSYARAFAADLWHTCFASNPLCRQTGQKYREEVLQWGGVKDPNEMLQGMLGRPLCVDAVAKDFVNYAGLYPILVRALAQVSLPGCQHTICQVATLNNLGGSAVRRNPIKIRWFFELFVCQLYVYWEMQARKLGNSLMKTE